MLRQMLVSVRVQHAQVVAALEVKFPAAAAHLDEARDDFAASRRPDPDSVLVAGCALGVAVSHRSSIAGLRLILGRAGLAVMRQSCRQHLILGPRRLPRGHFAGDLDPVY